MNFTSLQHWFNRSLATANEYGLGWLLIIVVVGFLIWYFAKGNKISLRIPFLPRFMNKVSFSKDDLSALKDKAEAKMSKSASPDPIASENPTASGSKPLPFESTFKLLFGVQERRYKIPTYMLISGDKADNDSEMLKELENVLGKKERLILKSLGNSQKYWHVYQQGCVLHDQDPANIVNELQQYRPERPVDGLIVTLPLSKLQSSTERELESWAGTIYKHIWHVQQNTGFILPIYLLVTECHELKGFNLFWGRDKLANKLDQQFGWANPYNHSEAYQPSWINEAITMLGKHIRNIQIAFMRNDGVQASTDNAAKKQNGSDDEKSLQYLLLANEFERLRPAITLFCNVLFSKTILQSPLMLRGLYFTGKHPIELESGKPEMRHLFLKELLEQKVFTENSMAFAPQSKLLSSNSKLRAYQYSSIVAFITLSLLLTIDSLALRDQTVSLVSSMNSEPKEINYKKEIDYINAVIDHVASMDAGSINYLSLPLSWNTPFNTELENYFSKHTFGEIMFPQLQCDMQRSLQSRMNDISQKQSIDSFSNWLDDFAVNVSKGKQLNDLIHKVHEPDNVLKSLEDIVLYLYDHPLPSSFYQRSDLYVRAIANSDNASKQSHCKIHFEDKLQAWETIMAYANSEVDLIVDELAAPRDFFSISEQMNSLPSVVSWYNKIPEFSDALSHYTKWSTHIRDYWLAGHAKPNECGRMHHALNGIAQEIFPEGEKSAEAFLNTCLTRAEKVLINDNRQLGITLYMTKQAANVKSEGNSELVHPFTLTQEAQTLFSEVDALNELSYIGHHTSNDKEALESGFFWSIENLNRALALQEEYETFALAEYRSLWLPKKAGSDTAKYFAQGIALKQLQYAMNDYVLNAQVHETTNFSPEHLRPVSQQEAYLAASIGNFKKSMDSVMALLLAFKQLEFTESYRWLQQISQAHAFELLRQVDRLYQDNHIFKPLDNARWSAHQYNDALFAITSDGQLQDYLAAQSERANYIAFEYAEPLIVFLLNTKGKYVNYKLFGKWQNSLIELNKAQNKDPSNSVDSLKLFMSNQLAVIDQSNCFDKTKELMAPTGSDIFADNQRTIIERAKDHCNSFKIDEIKKEYSEIVSLFNQYLAGKAPFTRSAKARQVSPQDMQSFLAKYRPLSDGLAHRMGVMVWKDLRYKDAQKFLRELDKSALLFSNILGATAGKDSVGVEMNVEFNVMENNSSFVRHLSQWQLQSGNDLAVYPGEPKAIFWKPGDSLQLTLNWAEQSPYKAFALNGSSRLQNQLEYSVSGLWSLLDFIKTYSSGVYDDESLNEHSRLLAFEAKVLPKEDQSAAPEPNQLKAYARLVLYGNDPKDNKKIVLEFPDSFPDSAPKAL